MNSAQKPTPKEVEMVAETLYFYLPNSDWVDQDIQLVNLAASAIVEHYRKVMEEKDRLIQSRADQLKNQKETNLHWYTKCADQQEEIRQLNLAIKLGDEKSAKQIASLKAENEKLNMQIQGYQVDDGYQKGIEHEAACWWNALLKFQYPGGNSEFDQAVKAKVDEVLAPLKAENDRLKSEEWMKKAAHKIYMDGMRGADELDYQEQTTDFVLWMKEAQLNSAEPLPEI